METKAKKSRLAGVPAWALSVLTLVAAFIVLRIFGGIDLHRDKEGLGPIFSIGSVSINEIIDFTIFLILIPIACFFICRLYPKSVWYTPVICNAICIIGLIVNAIGTIVDPDYGTTSTEWIIIASSIALSVTGAIVGARIGRRSINQAT